MWIGVALGLCCRLTVCVDCGLRCFPDCDYFVVCLCFVGHFVLLLVPMLLGCFGLGAVLFCWLAIYWLELLVVCVWVCLLWFGLVGRCLNGWN